MCKQHINLSTHFSENLDGGDSLKELILIQEKFMADNFPSALLILGGVGVGVHYEQIVKLYGGVPIIMAYGHPVSGKSTTVNAAMAVIGQQDNIGGNNSLISFQT